MKKVILSAEEKEASGSNSTCIPLEKYLKKKKYSSIFKKSNFQDCESIAPLTI